MCLMGKKKFWVQFWDWMAEYAGWDSQLEQLRRGNNGK